MSEALRALLDQLKSGGGAHDDYARALSRCAIALDDLREYCHFERDFYTRNLIERTPDFELLVLCWEPGQVTPIHGHNGSEGWVRGVEGSIEEVWYEVDLSDEDQAALDKGRTATLPAGDTTHVNDDIAWHTVGNRGPGRAVSLHLYSPPIDVCPYVDAGTGAIKTRTLSYHATGAAGGSSVSTY